MTTAESFPTTPLIPTTEAGGDPVTHRVAAGAYIFRGGRVLLLKRAKPPFTVAPPGGRLLPDEDPVDGVRREVREETGLEINILGVADTWFGSVDGLKPILLCIDYVAEGPVGEVLLNEEHTDYLWATRAEVEKKTVVTLDEAGHGYKPEDILFAFDLYEALHGTWSV